MATSKTKMQMVIANYFKDECDVNTSIRQAFEKGFRIGVKKGASTDRLKGKWIDKTIPVSRANPYGGIIVGTACSVCGYDGEDEQLGKISYRIVERFNFCPNCGARMKGADDDN